MEDRETKVSEKSSQLANIIITQAICVGLILMIILVTKYFFGTAFEEFSKFYSEQLCNDTDIYEVIGEKNEI